MRIKVWLASLLSLAIAAAVAYGAANRSVPTSGTLLNFAQDLNEELDQLYDVSAHPLDSVAGTNTITASVADMPSLTAYVNGMEFVGKPANTNTGATTLNIDSVGAKSVVTAAGSALVAGDLVAGTAYRFRYLGGADDHFRVLSNLGAVTSTEPTPDVQTFSSTGAGTWTKPSGGQTMCRVQLWAAGGSGGKGAAAAAAAGGGGGEYKERLYRMAELGATEPLSIGAGGASQTTASTDGTAGGNSTFSSSGNLLTAYGGGPGNGDGAGGLNGGGHGGGPLAAGGNAAFSVTISNTVIPTVRANYPYVGIAQTSLTTENAWDGSTGTNAGSGGSSSDAATTTNGAGGNSIDGGAGGGAGAEDSSPGAGTGGSSVNGGAGGAGAFDASNATAGSQPGGGGGGSETGDSGAGGNGKGVVTCW